MWLLLALCTVATFLPKSSNAQPDKSPLKVGVILPLSGPLGKFGQEMLNGAKLAVAGLKSSIPEVAGRIKLIERDDGSDPEKIEAIIKSMVIARQADIYFGSLTSSATLNLIKAMRDARKPLVIAASTHDSLTNIGPFVFRSSFSDSFQGTLLANFARRNLKKKSAAIIYDSTSDYMREIAASFKKTFSEQGGTIVADLAYEPKTGDFDTMLTKAKSAKPQILVAPGFYRDAAKIIEIAYRKGLRVPVLGTDGWQKDAFFSLAPKQATPGHYIVTHFSAKDPSPEVQKFVGLYRQQFRGEPGQLAAMGYDAVMLIADAFKRAKTKLTNGFTRALNSTQSVPGLLGPFLLDPQRNAIKSAVMLKTTTSSFQFHARVTPQELEGLKIDEE